MKYLSVQWQTSTVFGNGNIVASPNILRQKLVYSAVSIAHFH